MRSGFSGLEIALQTPLPRAKGHRAREVPIQPNLCVGLWRGSPSWSLTIVCFCASASLKRLFRETGATRATRSPKSERGTFGANKFARKVPRSLSRLRRASPPYPMRDGQHRAQSTDKPAWSASRAAFGYSRANGDSTRTLRGRSAQGARIGRPSVVGAAGR